MFIELTKVYCQSGKRSRTRMTISPEQEEELEVLQSIFEGDDAFKQLSEKEFQYKIGEDGSSKSFLLTIKWPEKYPATKLEVNLDSFYNKHIIVQVKESIIEGAYEQADALLGDAVTYTIIDWAKQNAEALMADQPDFIPKAVEVDDSKKEEDTTAKKKEKREQLTKAQKRKLADRIDASGDRPRGFDWVDVVKHLAQTGRATD